MRSWNYKLLCGAVCLAQLACLSLPVWAAENNWPHHSPDHDAGDPAGPHALQSRASSPLATPMMAAHCCELAFRTRPWQNTQARNRQRTVRQP